MLAWPAGGGLPRPSAMLQNIWPPTVARWTLLHVLCKSGIGARSHISHVSPVFSSIPRATKKHKLSITANAQAQKWIRFILHVADAQTFEAFAGDIKPYKK
jgi:hypothetical protein